nr:AsmA family protein [Rhodovastum atsumiense]
MSRSLKIATGVIVALAGAIALLIAVWNWDWFVPLAERQASASLGRPVNIQHLHLTLARNPVVTVEGLEVENPPDFPDDAPPLARIERIGVTVDAMAWLRDRSVGLTEITVIRPVVEARALSDGRNNWTFTEKTDPAQAQQQARDTAGGSRPTLGAVHIEDGHLHALVPRLRADFSLDIATRAPPGDTSPEDRQKQSRIVVTAKGTYAGAPITGRFEGGALLAIRDKDNPYPVDLHLENGPTQVDLKGTLLDPTAFGGADLRLDLRGPNIARLTPLSGIPLPDTRPFRLTGRIDYAQGRFRFTDISGKVGRSDIGGTISVDPGTERPQVAANLASERIDLADLGGLIGANPNAPTPPPTAKLLPDTPISLPALRFADVDLTYRGKRIEGKSMPLDDLAAELTLKDGALRVHPATFGVGRGRIEANVALTPLEKSVRIRADVAFRQLDLARIMAATQSFGGGGTIGGQAVVEGSGTSLATILGAADGSLKLFMTGGDLSALLVNLSGLEFGTSLLSALGLPDRTRIRCMVADLPLRQGMVELRTLVLDTEAANVIGTGRVNLRNETLNLELKTEAKHFSIGSLPGPIDIGGRLRSPTIRPGAETTARAGAAAGLGLLLTPLAALIPTIQLGLGEDNDCGAMIRGAQTAR